MKNLIISIKLYLFKKKHNLDDYNLSLFDAIKNCNKLTASDYLLLSNLDKFKK